MNRIKIDADAFKCFQFEGSKHFEQRHLLLFRLVRLYVGVGGRSRYVNMGPGVPSILFVKDKCFDVFRVRCRFT